MIKVSLHQLWWQLLQHKLSSCPSLDFQSFNTFRSVLEILHDHILLILTLFWALTRRGNYTHDHESGTILNCVIKPHYIYI